MTEPGEWTAATAAAAAFDEAHRFVAHLRGRSLDDWRDIVQRVRAVDATAHAAALRRTAALVAAHPDAATFRALQDAACAAAPTEAAAGPGTGPACSLAGRVAAHAAFALALREALTAHEFAALYAPFARPTTLKPPIADACADRRTDVPALPAVAAPLATTTPDRRARARTGADRPRP